MISMAEPMNDILGLARAVSQRLAGGSLTPASAKLYSQHTRLVAGQPGLGAWREGEADARLEEAVRLIDAGLLQRSADDANWSDAVLRAAELLEWLAHPTLNLKSLPMHLMSAAAYQLAGYPARAAGLLSLDVGPEMRAAPLHALLSGDFPRLLRQLVGYWGRNPRTLGEAGQIHWAETRSSVTQLRTLVEGEMASALGVLCGALRWGEEDRIDRALKKLEAVANFMLNGRDPYSWLLAKLVAETARTFVANSLRSRLAWLPAQFHAAGKLAVERYLRQAYVSCRTQAWPSQQRGIERLAAGGSFVLCTPTGSGKTTVAEIAILQRLFSSRQDTRGPGVAPLVMYLVPKRALAAEVEGKLLRTFSHLGPERIVVTGLYGGIDWGPTDAWLTNEERTVLICTYEKAEALIRFLGPLFLGRLSLVVLDEAHMVQFDGRAEDLQSADSRPLRLESLVARLLSHIPEDRSQVIALSAVAAGMEATLANWVTGDISATPAKTLYRSTRQLIGRLQCKAGGSFDIRYDLLDRASLRFDETGEGGTPFIPEPFPPHPRASAFESAGPEKRLRPHLFWAAMHLVSPANASRRHAVLISIPQRIGGYAEDLLTLIEGNWSKASLPTVFEPPADAEKRDKWKRCLRACEDYFGTTSREYRLLERGIVVHHGKMPGLMARLLVQLVDDGVVHLILATSTLSEGVNLPFEVVLLPTLRRGKSWISASEFANLAGRAGRPGSGTEGKCLVLLDAKATDWSAKQVAGEYKKLIARLAVGVHTALSSSGSRSALAELLTAIWTQWRAAAQSTSEATFLKWLESTATLSPPATKASTPALIETLDSLDGVLLASIVEIEELAGAPLAPADLEGKLADIWRHCYAHYVSKQEASLGRWFRHRGVALVARIYADPDERRRLYSSGLPPRLGRRLSELYPTVRQYLVDGADYAARNSDGQFAFMKELVALLATHPRFTLAKKTPSGVSWESILRWWLDPNGPIAKPGATQVSEWYDYVAKNFSYGFSWGIGCVLALAANEAHNGRLRPTTLDSWDELGLPWIALWLKELMVWGTLDPVSAYLLGRGRAETRQDAATLAVGYYDIHRHLDPNEQLDPKHIRRWMETQSSPIQNESGQARETKFKVTLARTFPKTVARRWRVLPTVGESGLLWVDPAGYLLASGEREPGGIESLMDNSDFFLDVDSGTVERETYL